MTNISEIANAHEITVSQLSRAAIELYDILNAYNPKEVQAVAALIEQGVTLEQIKDYNSTEDFSL